MKEKNISIAPCEGSLTEWERTPARLPVEVSSCVIIPLHSQPMARGPKGQNDILIWLCSLTPLHTNTTPECLQVCCFRTKWASAADACAKSPTWNRIEWYFYNGFCWFLNTGGFGDFWRWWLPQPARAACLWSSPASCGRDTFQRTKIVLRIAPSISAPSSETMPRGASVKAFRLSISDINVDIDINTSTCSEEIIQQASILQLVSSLRQCRLDQAVQPSATLAVCWMYCQWQFFPHWRIACIPVLMFLHQGPSPWSVRWYK